jgi:hypothetical protein
MSGGSDTTNNRQITYNAIHKPADAPHAFSAWFVYTASIGSTTLVTHDCVLTCEYLNLAKPIDVCALESMGTVFRTNARDQVYEELAINGMNVDSDPLPDDKQHRFYFHARIKAMLPWSKHVRSLSIYNTNIIVMCGVYRVMLNDDNNPYVVFTSPQHGSEVRITDISGSIDTFGALVIKTVTDSTTTLYKLATHLAIPKFTRSANISERLKQSCIHDRIATPVGCRALLNCNEYGMRSTIGYPITVEQTRDVPVIKSTPRGTFKFYHRSASSIHYRLLIEMSVHSIPILTTIVQDGY